MKKLMTAMMTTMTLMTSAYAGGSTGMAPLPDGIVSCSGTQGEILFNVFKKDYKGEILNLRDAKGAIVKLTDAKIIEKAKHEGFVREFAWDQTRFLESLGIDPKTHKDSLTLFVEINQALELMPVVNLQGGPLKTAYSSAHLMIKSEIAPYKQVAPKVDYFLNLSVKQLNDHTYTIAFNKIASGQTVCVREEEMPNPYFIPGSGALPTFIGCVEFKDISEQKSVASFSTTLKIDSCRLLK